ncbi:hypothetical protein R3W88_025944 [Solanum pinnatisectum]|uniref:Uncharacterized protein n=1 Tax=Solanum pinnatisectum TaxID=50273 RepID=A0AAV9M4M7_9SOLN|nr:hypothetical protein R3W88_025944 [Solanum pinnatisectum]
MEKLRHVDIFRVEFDLEEDKQELSSKLENLRILKNILRFPIDRMDVLSRRCPNLQQLEIGFGDDNDSAVFLSHIGESYPVSNTSPFLWGAHIVSGLQLPSNLNKLVLEGIHIESAIPFIAGLPSLEYLQLLDMYVPQSEVWCFGDITFHKLKLLKLMWLHISRWDASEESFPLLETLVIKDCNRLEEIPLSFADIQQIKLVMCKNLEASTVRFKKDVEENEGNDRIDLIIKVSKNKLLCFVFEYLPASNLAPICLIQNYYC